MAIVAKENNLGARRGVAAGTVDKKTSGLIGENLPAGVLVVKAADQTLTAPASAADVARSIGALEYEPGKLQYDDGIEFRTDDQAVVIQRGEMYLECEEAMVSGADVFVRHTANGAGKLQKGAIRGDADDAGSTLTVDTAANSSLYSVALNGVSFSITSDSDATVDEIATALAAAINAHASFTASAATDEVTVATTLNGGQVVPTLVDSRITFADGATCARLPNARVLYDTSSTTPCIVQLNLPA